MLAIDPGSIDTQRIGRMGELVVELELAARGWFVGNFNASVNNSAGWDLFATREGRSVKLRVKAKRPGTDCFRWSAKPDGSILHGLTQPDDGDFVSAVNFLPAGGWEIYNVPAHIVEEALRTNHAAYLAVPRRDGGAHKDGTQRNLYLDEDARRLGHGFRAVWRRYLNAWEFGRLDSPASTS